MNQTNENVRRWLTPDADKLFLGYSTPAQASDKYKGVTPKRSQESYSLQCADIEGAAASTLKSWRPRTTPTNPLEPNYGWIDGTELLSGSMQLARSKPRRRAPQDEVSRLMRSTGKLQAAQQQKERRSRKDFRNTNDISDIQGSAPRPLIGRTSGGVEVRRGADVPLDTQSTWRSERVEREELRAPPGSKEEILAHAGFNAEARERLMRKNAGLPNGFVATASAQTSSSYGSAPVGSVPMAQSHLGTDVRRNNFDDRVHSLKLVETHLVTPGVQLGTQPLARGNRYNLKGGPFSTVSQSALPRSDSYIGASDARRHPTLERDLGWSNFRERPPDVPELSLTLGSMHATSRPDIRLQGADAVAPPPATATLQRSMSTTDIPGAKAKKRIGRLLVSQQK